MTPSNAPSNAIKVWTDGLRIFAEVGGYISAYPLTEGALSQILSIIKTRRVDYSGPPQYVEPKRQPNAHAQSVLLRLGILQPHNVRR